MADDKFWQYFCLKMFLSHLNVWKGFSVGVEFSIWSMFFQLINYFIQCLLHFILWIACQGLDAVPFKGIPFPAFDEIMLILPRIPGALWISGLSLLTRFKFPPSSSSNIASAHVSPLWWWCSTRVCINWAFPVYSVRCFLCFLYHICVLQAIHFVLS